MILLLQIFGICGILAVRFVSGQNPNAFIVNTPKGRLKGVEVEGVDPQSGCTGYFGKKKAVMVYVHGGGFIVGSGASSQTPESQCRGFGQEDVIVVMIQYRLGVFGFLSFGDDGNGVAPGNYGIHDQVMALRWIHENIGAFGGDPDRVTIFGQSAGGASVSILSLLTTAQPYFTGAISMSGTIFGYWVLNEEPVQRSLELRDAFNCKTGRGLATDLNCLRAIPAEKFPAKIKELQGPQMMYVPKKEGVMTVGEGGGQSALESMTFHLNPRIDNRLIFDPNQMVQKLGNKLKPFIVGTTGAETTFFLSPKMPLFQYMFSNDSVNFWVNNDVTEETFDQTLQKSATYWSKVTNSEPINDVVPKGRDVYLDQAGYQTGDKKLMSQQFFKLTSNIWADAPVLWDAEMRKSAGGNVWMYNLNRPPNPSMTPTNVEGAHGDDLYYIFVNFNGMDLPSSDTVAQRIRRTLIDSFVRFAKTGKPSDEKAVWPQYESVDRPLNLRMTQASDYVDTQFHSPTVPFWVSNTAATKLSSFTVQLLFPFVVLFCRFSIPASF